MIIESKKIIYIHTRKCGGSSIIQSFGSDITDWDRYNCGTLSKGIMPDGKDYGDWDDLLKKEHFIFSSIRNPWDKMVSSYFYSQKGLRIHGCQMTFKDFIISLPNKEQDFNWWIHVTANLSEYLYTENGLAPHVILRFEDLTNEYNKMIKEFGLDYNLPHINKSDRPKDPYQNMYDDELRKMVADLFEEDIDNFKYTFK